MFARIAGAEDKLPTDRVIDGVDQSAALLVGETHGRRDYVFVYNSTTNEVIFHNGEDGKKGYRAHFSHDNEQAEPGYYKVHLDSN